MPNLFVGVPFAFTRAWRQAKKTVVPLIKALLNLPGNGHVCRSCLRLSTLVCPLSQLKWQLLNVGQEQQQQRFLPGDMSFAWCRACNPSLLAERPSIQFPSTHLLYTIIFAGLTRARPMGSINTLVATISFHLPVCLSLLSIVILLSNLT